MGGRGGKKERTKEKEEVTADLRGDSVCFVGKNEDPQRLADWRIQEGSEASSANDSLPYDRKIALRRQNNRVSPA